MKKGSQFGIVQKNKPSLNLGLGFLELLTVTPGQYLFWHSIVSENLHVSFYQCGLERNPADYRGIKDFTLFLATTPKK